MTVFRSASSRAARSDSSSGSSACSNAKSNTASASWAKTFNCAARVAGTRLWARVGDRSPAHGLAKQTGITIGDALTALAATPSSPTTPAPANDHSSPHPNRAPPTTYDAATDRPEGSTTVAGRLTGQSALVTGAAAGIGRATARRFAAEGATIVAGDIDRDGLGRLAHELGDQVLTQYVDVTDEGSVEALVALALERTGRLDVTVANAGGGLAAELIDLTLDDWRHVIDLCLTGVFLTVKHSGRAMGAAGSGSIIVLASLNATQPGRGMGAYCSAKAGVAMLTQVAALELGPAGVRVNAIAPGLVMTSATAPMRDVPGVVDEFIENAPLGRYAEPEEIANVALFLATDESSYMSGALVPVDGGARTRRYPDMIAGIERLLGQG